MLPGPRLDGASLFRLIEATGVTSSAGVPTIWLGLLAHLRESGHRFTRPPRLVIGGSACPLPMIEAFEQEYGVDIGHAWGMTETSPIGLFNAPKLETLGRDEAEQRALKRKQGRPVPGIRLRIADAEGSDVPADGVAFGEILVRGPGSPPPISAATTTPPSPRTAGSAPATSPPSMAAAMSRSSTAPRT